MAKPMEAPVEDTEINTGGPYLDGLLPALQRLDRLLDRAVAAAHSAYRPEAAADPFRGLHIGPDEVARLLAREPGAPTFQADGNGHDDSLPDSVNATSRLAWLAIAFDLSPFDVDLILIALAPELDLRYERLYAYLQDDVSRRRPSVDLALNLLCPSADAKLVRRIHFGSDAPLVRHGLIRLIPDPNQVEPPLLAHYFKLDEQIVRLLLGHQSLDSRLVPFCQMIEPAVSLDDLPLSTEVKRALPAMLAHSLAVRTPVRLYFQGPPGAGKRRTAEALAGEVGAPLLAADLVRALSAGPDFERLLKLLFREAWFQDAVLYLEGLDALRNEERSIQYRRLLDVLAEDGVISILAGAQPWVPVGRGPIGVISVPFPIPDVALREACWHDSLAAEALALGTDDIEALAGRFRLTPNQIADAVAVARNQARWRAADRRPTTDDRPPTPDEQVRSSAELPSLPNDRPTLLDLFAAARMQSGHDLAALAHKIEPVYTWDDIVLPDDTSAQLRELCQRVAQRQRVLGDWGFDRKLSLGKGVNALFAGPSGTGKTMAAEVIANELGLDLYKIDLSGIVSKYIGETEKNLDKIFTAAENANAILFFDEADALFGKRSEVHDSHDRYANIEISYLLQKMEQYQGITILASNLGQNLDDAFVRRLAFTVHFPFPDEADRRRIWSGIWPAATPLAGDVDLDFLSGQFKLSGGNIKNVALAAAFLAASDGGTVAMAHLFHATQREYQKLGKTLSAAELYGAHAEAI
jgi:SpoVK/Ycf46/Vps4 family AAA+-type ATPase